MVLQHQMPFNWRNILLMNIFLPFKYRTCPLLRSERGCLPVPFSKLWKVSLAAAWCSSSSCRHTASRCSCPSQWHSPQKVGRTKILSYFFHCWIVRPLYIQPYMSNALVLYFHIKKFHCTLHIKVESGKTKAMWNKNLPHSTLFGKAFVVTLQPIIGWKVIEVIGPQIVTFMLSLQTVTFFF